MESFDSGSKKVYDYPSTRRAVTEQRAGRFKIIADNLHINEVFASGGTRRRRYVIAYNPQQAQPASIKREQILERLFCELDVLNRKNKTKE